MSQSVTPVPWCGRNTGRRLDPNAVFRLYLDKLHTLTKTQEQGSGTGLRNRAQEQGSGTGVTHIDLTRTTTHKLRHKHRA